MEGYAVVVGPKPFIVFPGVPGGFWLVANWVELSCVKRGVVRFHFLSDSPYSTTGEWVVSMYVGLFVNLYIFCLIEIQILVVKVGFWLVGGRLVDLGTLLCRGFFFFWYFITVGFSM
jgi:hypothetical protein